MMNGRDRRDKQHIQVFARIRPFSDAERMHNANQYLQVNGKEIVVPQPHNNKRFTFDKVFDMHSKQVNIYRDAISPIIQEVLKGYNCTVFAYGQTGSGKTHTMVGPELAENAMTFTADSEVGIIPRAMGHIFDCLSKEKELDYTIRVSYLEIYNEVLNDLLSNDDKILRIYEDPKNKSSVQIHGLEEVTVYNKKDVYELLRLGSEKRKIAATYMNQQSSRSHSVFTITVHMKETTPEGEELVKTGKLNLVDLAGSENIQRSGAVDQRAREAGNINQSLLTLGRVIKALVDKAGHIPYRESKLTRILQDSLGGKTKTTIIATASPAISNIEETLSTLDYAFRARNIITKPEVNQRLCKTALIKGYLEEIDKLKKDLTAARKGEGFYLNADTYHTLIQENVANREEYLRAVKECAEFENRASELHRQCTELEVVYSVTQNDLSQAKDTLTRSKLHLKQLCRDRHIRQELIDKYSETELQHFQTSKEMSVAFDNHIKEHNILRDKLDRFYNSMKQNENAADCFDKEQTQIAGTIEDNYDKLHEDVIKQLQDTKKITFEFVQQQGDSISKVNKASDAFVESYLDSIQRFSQHLKRGQTERLRALEESCNLSKEIMHMIKEHIDAENVHVNEGLNEICTYIDGAKTTHQTTFVNWQMSIDELSKTVQDNCDATIANVQSMNKETKKILLQFSEEMKTLSKPMDDAANERSALQKAFDAYMKKNEELQKEHENLIATLSNKCSNLNKPSEEIWNTHEIVMKANVTTLNEKIDGINKVAVDGIAITNRAFEELPIKVAAIKDKCDNDNKIGNQIIVTKNQTFCEVVNDRKRDLEIFDKTVKFDFKKTKDNVVEMKEVNTQNINDLKLNIANYNNAHNNNVSTVIDTVKTGVQVCSSGLAALTAVVKSFISNLQVPKPSGETPSHKNGITYNIPRKLSKRVLQYPDLDLSSISILDESMEMSCGRPSLDFFDQSDSDVEYQGQFVTTKIARTRSSSCKSSLGSNGNDELQES